MSAPADGAAALPPIPAGLLDSFDVIRPLGAGGMGAVWLVRDRFLDRPVALKVLIAQVVSTEQRERFLLEARTSARLEHPHIIDVYRADETDGTVWFTMRYVDGESLGDRIRARGALGASEIARILREVSWGLAYAHARGVIHRDIKPDNILLDRDSGRAVLTDFGIARDMDAESRGLTIAGHVLGTVHYMSPEQASGDVVDARSDIYALGVVGFHALTGALPFDGPAHSVLVAHVTKPAPAVHAMAPEALGSLARVIDRCLQKEPTDRFPSADALATAFDEALRDALHAEQAAADAAPGAVISELEAQAIWQRAAQLQAAAALRLERGVSLTASPESGEHGVPSGSYRVRDVEAAAIEAGISRQYVALALAERDARTGAVAMQVVSDSLDRQFTTLMGTTERAISVSRVLPMSPQRALAALGTVFTSEPNGFTFEGAVNGHPLDGGILRFRVPRLTTQSWWNPLSMLSSGRKLLYRLEQIELFDLSVTLQARGSAQHPSCEVIITGDLRTGLRRNLYTDWAMMAGAAALAGGATAWAERAAGWVLSSGSLPAISVAGAAVIAGLGTAAWYRWLFRGALEGAKQELGALLGSVEQHVARQALFGDSPEAWKALSRPPAER
jgi:eukaryotic-like serine/threonine-protein kinase